jgi:hypothetical protein
MAKLQSWKSDLRELWSRLTGIGPAPTLEQSEEARRRFDQEYEALLAEMVVQASAPSAAPSTPRPWPPARATASPAERRVRDRRLSDQISETTANVEHGPVAGPRPNRRAASGG